MLPDITVRDLMTLRPPGSWLAEGPWQSRRQPPELACLFIPLEPQRPCLLPFSPAQSLHAALLRRLGETDSSLSLRLYEAPQSRPTIDRAWTVSSLLGRMETSEGGLVALPGELYWVRVTALTHIVIDRLHRAFSSPDTMEIPLELEHVPFKVLTPQAFWTAFATYDSLRREVRPRNTITLSCLSPTGFRGKRLGQLVPEPSLCLEGYLRKWNAHAPEPLPAQRLLPYASRSIQVAEASVRVSNVAFKGFTESGVTGHWRWRVQGDPSHWLRMVNLLSNFAFFCGTGKKTIMSMGQTMCISQNEV